MITKQFHTLLCLFSILCDMGAEYMHSSMNGYILSVLQFLLYFFRDALLTTGDMTKL